MDFDFHLPATAIATTPADPRDDARLLVYQRATGERRHLRFRDLPGVLAAGDLLVANDTRVLPNRLIGRRTGGGRLEALVLERDGATCDGYLKPAARLKVGVEYPMEGGALLLTPLAATAEGRWSFRLRAENGDLTATLARVGRAPLPPYIDRDDGEDPVADRLRYQTVFAANEGAVAAPTAGIHFTTRLLDELKGNGIEWATVTLHVGPGTFTPVRVDDVRDHRMHAEAYELPPATAAAVAATRARGGRVVAVGTTSARTLETCALDDRLVRSGTGTSDLFLYPGAQFRVIDALITNFHLPQSTLLMLVSAFAGRTEILDLYAEAIELGYRFYSYGDAMLLL